MLKLPDFIADFMKQFSNAGYKIYLVGGTVRGLIMDHPVNDWDFTTDATPEQIMKLFPHSYYNNQFGTVGIPLKHEDDNLVFEVTTHRKESEYTNVRHPDKIEWSKDLNGDLARRDFTINAIAYDGETLYDPFDGQKDIKDRIIRAVGDPNNRLKEDALRLMRAVRQAAQLGFLIEKSTKDSIQKNSHLITSISWERIRDEFFKILSSKNPAEGILFLKNTHILKNILPEVEASFGVDQKSPERHHMYDVGTHLVESLRHCPSENVITRFAALIHDVGKVETYQKDEKTKIITFYNHEVVGEKQAEQIANRFKLSKEEKKQLVLLVRHHQFTVSEDQSDKAVRRFIRQIGVENIDEMLALRTGDRLGSGAKESSWRTELFKKRLTDVQNIPFSVHDLNITGNDVMKELGIKPSPKVGEVMNKLFEMIDDEKLKNVREELLAQLQKIKKTAE
ncbi:MAG: CCA tRNA nucleotidyltransferase [Candidatus Roizmanbacteria bacterium]|nr:CCA tRNA nucleotidyltransferase [Candidatus Roizmanbacteria bacterium]